MQDIDHISVDKLNLSKRTYHALMRSGVFTLGDLKKMHSKGYLRQILYIGEKALSEISMALDQINLNPPKITEVGTSSTHFQMMASDSCQNVSQLTFVDKSSDQFVVSGKDVENEKINQAPITVLDLSRRIKHALLKNDIKTIGDLRKFSATDLIQFGHIGPKTASDIQQTLLDFINHPQENLTNVNAMEFKSEKKKGFENTFISRSKSIIWAELVEEHFNTEKDNRTYILLARFGFRPQTLGVVAKKLGVTRERVRQIQDSAIGNFHKHVRYSIVAELLEKIEVIFCKYGNGLSLISFKEILEKENILGRFSKPIVIKYIQEVDVLETLICWLNLLSYPKYSFSPVPLTFSVDIHDLIRANTNSINEFNTLRNVSTKQRRAIKRKVEFTGGIDLKEAMNILSADEKIAGLVMEKIGLQKVEDTWYSLKNFDPDRESRKIPLRLAGQKMLSVAPVIELNCFYDGLRRYVNRFYSSLAPVNVIAYILPLLGFAVDNDRKVSAIIPIGDVLSRSEKTFMVAIHKNDGVASFLEVAEEFFLQNHSLPAVSVTLKRYPIVEKIEEGLYKLRGMEISWQQIEIARKRQKRFSQDDEVIHGLDGIIRMRLTINSYTFLTGVVGAHNIKELPGSWAIICNGESYGDAKIEEAYLWGLSKVFKKLNVKMGERIELGFNTWNRILSVEKANYGNT